MFAVQIVLITDFGEFFGEKLTVTEEQYQTIIKYSQEYYKKGFEMRLIDDSFAIFSPEIVSKSILMIKKISNV